MKCVKSRKSGSVARMSNAEAEFLVANGFTNPKTGETDSIHYVPKRVYRRAMGRMNKQRKGTIG